MKIQDGEDVEVLRKPDSDYQKSVGATFEHFLVGENLDIDKIKIGNVHTH